jgi:hypothetical protein
MPSRARRNPYAIQPPGQETVEEDLLHQRVLNRCRELDLWTMSIPKIRSARGGWRTAYHPLSRGKGWLDVFIAGVEALAVELKVGGNSLEPEQREWMRRLTFAKVPATVWTEQHWATGLIEAELCRLAGGVRYGYHQDGFTPSREFGPDLVVSSGLAARAVRGGTS